MKNQYFGDINDYRKYGLLRCLAEGLGVSIGVCWMLTEDDDGTDGSLRAYLQDEARWQRYDPVLYRRLLKLRDPGVRRSVASARRWGLIPWAGYYSRFLNDDAEQRAAYFARASALLAGCPLLFFDPDNGLEVKSVRLGRRGSCKYLYWDEVESAFATGHSLLIYQHFPREERDPFIARKAQELSQRLQGSLVHVYRTQRVVFLLALHPEHARGIATANRLVESRWGEEIRWMAPGESLAPGSC
jgi:hypothetical protein